MGKCTECGNTCSYNICFLCRNKINTVIIGNRSSYTYLARIFNLGMFHNKFIIKLLRSSFETFEYEIKNKLFYLGLEEIRRTVKNEKSKIGKIESFHIKMEKIPALQSYIEDNKDSIDEIKKYEFIENDKSEIYNQFRNNRNLVNMGKLSLDFYINEIIKLIPFSNIMIIRVQDEQVEIVDKILKPKLFHWGIVEQQRITKIEPMSIEDKIKSDTITKNASFHYIQMGLIDALKSLKIDARRKGIM